jgi:DNA-binding NtrC family response regulator
MLSQLSRRQLPDLSYPQVLMLAGSSPIMQAVRDQLRQVAAVDFRVRIEGPSGSGKGVAARLIHAWSRRTAGPFHRQSLATIPPGLEHGRLFGWAKGAFTGAVAGLPGVLEAAYGGTLFLDEIACGSRIVQEALLQLLEDRDVLRLGERRSRTLDIRFLFATNVDLVVEVEAGRFRPDLLPRMGGLVVRMPALADHLEDVPELVDALLPRVAAAGGCPVRALSATDMEALQSHSWPGNVRELENVMAFFLTFGHLPPLSGMSEAEELRRALARHGWNKSRTGRELGISRKAVNDRIHRFGLLPDAAAAV